MPLEFSKEVERTYLVPQEYSIPNVQHTHIRQSHIYKDSTLSGLIEGTALSVHKALIKMSLTNDDLDRYMAMLLSVYDQAKDKFVDQSIYSGYKFRVRIINRKEGEITIKGKLKDSSQETKENHELNISIPIKYACFLLTQVGEASKGKQILGRDLTWITKMRYDVPGEDGKKWDVDNYLGANRGVKTADVNLTTAQEKAKLLHDLMKPLFGESAKQFDVRTLQVRPFAQWTPGERLIVRRNNASDSIVQ